MSATSTADDPESDGDDHRREVPAIVEWLVGGLLAIGGIGVAMGGIGVLWATDTGLIADAVADGVTEGTTIPGDTVTPAQMTEIATSTAFWLGVGLVVTGLGVLLVAVLYVLARYRSRRAGTTSSAREDLFSHALLGAVATGLLSFVPASPILGGGVAGYLHGSRTNGATRAGALSGLLGASPFLVILAFLAVGLFVGFSNAGVGLGLVAALAILIAIIGTVIYAVGLGALGGYLADRIATDHTDRDRRGDH